MRKRGRGKPPFPTCKLEIVESNNSPHINLQVGKGGLPPPTLNGFDGEGIEHAEQTSI